MKCRKEAYTCWQQASGARVNNWGTRIDLILAADGASTSEAGAEKVRQFFLSDLGSLACNLTLQIDTPVVRIIA